MMRTALLCSTALIFCAAGSALAAERARPATHFSGTVHRVIAAVPGAVTLYDQNNDDNDVAIISTNFDDFDSFDSYAADDFTVPHGHTWKIKQVEVTGNYSADSGDEGPAHSESVFFYRDASGLPGELAARCENLLGRDNQGSFAIKIPTACKISLKGGRRYWLSVVATMSISCCGRWNWMTRHSKIGKPAAWENPEGGFQTGCFAWDVMTSCIGGFGEGPDFMFALKGKDVVR